LLKYLTRNEMAGRVLWNSFRRVQTDA